MENDTQLARIFSVNIKLENSDVYPWVTAEMEVGNQYNLFVKEMRKVYK